MSDADKLRDEMSDIWRECEVARMQIGACLFNPARNTYPVHNAKKLAALATALVELTAVHERIAGMCYAAMSKARK